MSIEVRVPALPESVADALVINWHKQPGEAVQRDEVLVEIETDKVVLEVPAPTDGVLQEIVQANGQTVTADQVLAIIGEGAAASAVKPASATQDKTEPLADKTKPVADKPKATGNGAAVDIRVPVLPESVADGLVLAWRKRAGDAVSRGEVLVEIETDKVVLEVPSPGDGVLREILHDEGATVTAEQVLGVVSAGETAGAPASTGDSAAPAGSGDARAAAAMGPAARSLISEHGLDAAAIAGSGKRGRITKDDVLRHMEQAGSAPAKAAAAVAEPAAPTPAAAPGASRAPAVQLDDESRTQKRVPMTRLRARIAERLLQATQTTAMLTTFNEVDMKPLIELRKRYKETFEKTHGIKLGFMSPFVKAATEALKRFPEINASIDGPDVVYHGFCDIGVAVSSERGLVVPVLRDAEHMSLAEIEKTILDYGTRAREGKLSMEEMTGGTFTITNGGVFGSLLSTPILNPPQSAILGMHATQERAVVVDGEIVVRPMMYVALSYDHRIVDGKGAVTFLRTIKELVEDPNRILLDI